MKTAMIAALSCGLLMSFSARALECKQGHADVSLVSLGHIDRAPKPSENKVNLSASRYRVSVQGTSLVNVDEWKKGYVLESSRLYVSIGGGDNPVALKIAGAGGAEGQYCLDFDPWEAGALHDSGFVRIAPKAGAFVRACFAQPQRITADFDVELSSVNVAGADSLKAGSLRAVLLAERKSDNEDVALFDTDDACTK